MLRELDTLKVIIADQDPDAIAKLQGMLLEAVERMDVLGTAGSKADLKRLLEENPSVDCLFVEHELEDGTSLGLFEEMTIQHPVVFMSNKSQPDLAFFKPLSLGYLVKPIEKAPLVNSLQKLSHFNNSNRLLAELEELKGLLIKNQEPYKERLMIRLGQRFMYKSLAQVSYFFAEGKAAYLVDATDNRKFVIDHTLEELESVLNPNKFFRISRKFIVNIAFVSEARGMKSKRMELKLASGAHHELNVSRDRITDLIAWLSR